MEIILLERVTKLGQIGDVVNVKNGYARNFLLPQNKALRATKANREVFDAQRNEIEAQNLSAKKDAEAVASKMEGASAILIRQAGETGQLYGSVSSRDIVGALDDGGYKIERNQVVLNHSIKTLGIYAISIKLHPEVFVDVNINVARSAEEAEIQAKGGDAAAQADDEEISVEDYFENEDDAAVAADPEAAEEVEDAAEEETSEEASEEEKSE